MLYDEDNIDLKVRTIKVYDKNEWIGSREKTFFKIHRNYNDWIKVNYLLAIGKVS